MPYHHNGEKVTIFCLGKNTNNDEIIVNQRILFPPPSKCRSDPKAFAWIFLEFLRIRLDLVSRLDCLYSFISKDIA